MDKLRDFVLAEILNTDVDSIDIEKFKPAITEEIDGEGCKVMKIDGAKVKKIAKQLGFKRLNNGKHVLAKIRKIIGES